jgi:hypothetical protein
MKIYLILVLMFVSQLAIGGIGLQTKKQTNALLSKSSAIEKEKILLGPGLGFGMANRAFSLNIAPSVAYCLTENFHVGSTFGFNYYQEAFDYQNLLTLEQETYKYKATAYSLSVFARYLIGNFLILNFEPELNNTKVAASSLEYNLSTGKLQETKKRITIPSVLVGGGYAQRFGTYGYSYIMIAYDLVQNPNARYYQTLDYRIGVMFSLFDN